MDEEKTPWWVYLLAVPFLLFMLWFALAITGCSDFGIAGGTCG